MYEKLRSMLKRFSFFQISIYAGNAAFFLLLSVFPLATLLLGLVQYLPAGSEELLAQLDRILPEAAVPLFHYILGMNNPSAVISVSALTAVWSASRGTYGILRGLNRAFELKETRSYVRVRLQCVFDTLLLVAAIFVALLLSVFGHQAAELLKAGPFSFLINPVTRFLITTAMLILLFSGLYLLLPNHHISFRAVLPGAALAGAGWMAYSALYSLYVSRFSGMDRLYGSLTAVAVTMLWLYVCMEILFLGGIVNHCLQEKN